MYVCILYKYSILVYIYEPIHPWTLKIHINSMGFPERCLLVVKKNAKLP